MASVLNLNSPYLQRLRIREDESFNGNTFNIYETKEYLQSKENDLKLITDDEREIQKMMNIYILIQENYRIRSFLEMPEIIENANELIDLLQKEYL